jgi:hypothetical protein|uniref:Uncharacterized protein n=1 Tax=uncultured marine virus TaxID=186617 RepID=A0A0F7L4H0_9VIRU|nr:hypothetical protein [uncultured marine virus]
MKSNYLKNYPKKPAKARSDRILDPKYPFDYHAFEYNSIAVLVMDATPIHNLDKLYVMKVTECRGVIEPMFFTRTGKYLFQLMTYSDQTEETGLHLEYYSFKRKTVQTYHGWTFNVNEIIGHPESPMLINFDKIRGI